MRDTYTIGEISQLSGVSVRRIRFYSDKGLLPPSARASNGYRIYSKADVARLDLIRALRDAGVSLALIRKISARRLTLVDVLQMRLETLEAEIASRRRIAAVLRATLKVGGPTEADLRRFWTMTTLSKDQLRGMIEKFVDQVGDGFDVHEAWKAHMTDVSTPELPDEPTPKQIDAWIEILHMLTDKSLVAEMRNEMTSIWNGEYDLAAYVNASETTVAKAREAIARGDQPTSAAAFAIVRDWLDAVAKVMKRKPDKVFMEWARNHRRHSFRYYELLITLDGHDTSKAAAREWLWIHQALVPLLESAA